MNGTSTDAPVSLIHHTIKSAGGMESYVLDLLNALNNLGYTVECYCRKADKSLPILNSSRLHIFPLMNKVRPLRDTYFAARVRKALDLKKSHEITIARMSTSGVAICGGTHPGFRKTWNKSIKLYDRIQIALEKKLYSSAKAIIAHSDFLKNEIIDNYHVDPDKIHVVYPPVDQSRYRVLSDSDRELARCKLGLNPDQTIFLFPSANHKIKGLDYISNVFSWLPKSSVLLVAGKIDDSQEYPSNVKFLGYRTDMEQLYSAADYTVLGSRYEAFGLVGVESVLCGTKVILSDTIGCIPAIMSDAMMTFPCGDKEKLFELLELSIDLAKRGTHRVKCPLESLNYNPDVNAHVDILMSFFKS